MKPINLISLQVRIGKCNLNLKSDGYFGVSLQMGKHISSMSQIKSIINNVVSFNTTLRMNIQKQLVQQQAHAKCRVLLHLIRQNRQKKVIGIATIDIIQQNNQGFKYHQFGQCADCQADIQVSINYSTSSSFQLGVKSQIAYFYAQESPVQSGILLQNSREREFFAEDSIIDRSDYHVLKQSKAVSNIEPTSFNRNARPSLNLRVRRPSQQKKLRKAKPQNLTQRSPLQIIDHYQTEIKVLQQQLEQRDNWASGMKVLIQQLQAENQLLKQIKIDELQQCNIPNLQQGIDFVSKLVHSKFQASKSMIYQSSQSQSRSRLVQQSPQQQQQNQQLKQQIKQSTNQQQSQQQIQQRSLTQTRSFKGLPQVEISPPLIQSSPQKSQIQRNFPVLQSREQLQNALKILTGGQKTQQILQQNMRIAQLEQELFRVRQQRQSLYETTQQLLQQSKRLKLQRDEFYMDKKQLQDQLMRMQQYIEQIKLQNQKLYNQVQKLQKNSNAQDYQNLNQQNISLQDKCHELQRQLKESVKAIDEFKNDAVNARSQLITKEDELNSYRLKFGQLGSMTDVFLNNLQYNVSTQTNGQNKHDSPHKVTNSTTASTSNLHSLYTQLLQTTISERRQLHHSLSQIISSKTNPPSSALSTIKRQQGLKKLQTQINRLFVQIFKNNVQMKNIKQIEKAKVQVSKQIQEIVSLV